MKDFEKIIRICKQRGFVYPAMEIYGGLRGFYDYGPLGCLLRNKIRKLWLEKLVFAEKNIYLIESSIIGSRIIYEASGHLERFHDPLVECKKCHNRFRADHLIKGKYGEIKLKDNKPLCPLCQGELTEERTFNLMFKTYVGPVEELASEAYLRPETAQGMFINFKNVLQSTRAKLPFGIAQIGKSFRNEITPQNFLFRTREFEQMEIEFFVKPKEANKWFEYWVEKSLSFYQQLGFKNENLRKKVIPKEELAHYSKANVDIEYHFPWGFDELEGIANRGDYDLKRHSKFSGQDLSYFDEETKEKIIPYVIEPSFGLDRIFLAALIEFYDEDEIDKEKRVVFRFPPYLAPVEIAVFALLTNKKQLVNKTREVYQLLKENKFSVTIDESGSIGRRYRRQDEIGTPYCITIDFQTLTDQTVTIRDRDSTQQIRVSINELVGYFREKFMI